MSTKQRLELTWIGKDRELKIEPRILIEDPEKSYGDPNSENMLIHGDNLLALKALEQDYAGKIKCIYIDPPYNTGSAFEHYDDNVEHSIWLNLMRSRLELLRNLLSEDGSIWISIDENEGHYLKVICDEIFGRNNFIIQTVIQRGAATGHKAINPTPVQVCDLMLTYAKNKSTWHYLPVYRERSYDKAYSQYIENFNDDYSDWKFITLKQAIKNNGFTLDTVLSNFPERLIRFAQPSYSGVGQETRNLIDVSKSDPTRVYKQSRQGFPDIYLYRGNRILFYKDKLKEIDGKLTTAELVTNLWTDMNYQGIANEGGVTFQRSKKPELQVKRILEMATKPGDRVLDSFLGSGTTSAVAHKMGRKWIGIEMGGHAYTHCIPRLKSVVQGTDFSGISKPVNWGGGGGFKFYELAPSLLIKDSFGNWVFDPSYNAKMLAEAVCKHEGFKFKPNQDVYWKQGQSTETDYIFVTTSHLTRAHLDRIDEEMVDGESLLICAKSFDSEIIEAFPDITIKKIPQSILAKAEFGKENYNLNIVESKDVEEVEEAQE